MVFAKNRYLRAENTLYNTNKWVLNAVCDGSTFVTRNGPFLPAMLRNDENTCHTMRCIFVVLLLSLSACLPALSNPSQNGTDDFLIRVTDQKGLPLPYATVYIETLDRGYSTNGDGLVAIKKSLLQKQNTVIRFSYVGMATRSQTFTPVQVSEMRMFTMRLEPSTLYLKEVQVNAVRERRQSASSIVIDRNTIDNIQAYSLADIMQVLPGKAILNTDMHNAAFLTLRSTLSGSVEDPLEAYSRNKINDFTRNAAFGISFVVDGIPQSNNANMQLDSYGKWGGIKTFDRKFNTDNNENVANGNDLRLIPSSSIESIEVISGVAPVKYGDLSNGAVIINRRAGLTPFYGAVKAQSGILNASLGKGISLGDKYGLLHLNIDYIQSTRDKRDDLKTNSNLALNATWTKTFSRTLKWENTLSADFSQNLDGLKNDPDAVLNRSLTRQTAFKLAARGHLSPKDKWFFDQADYNLALSLTRQYNMHEEYISGIERTIITDDYTPGVHETDIAPPRYNAKMEIEGMPVSAYFNAEGRRLLNWGKSVHNLSVGVFGRYEANLGRGKIFDAEHPYFLGNVGGRGDRSYAFRNRIRMGQYGLYLQDRLSVPIGAHTLSTTAGLRAEVQHRRLSVSPRINVIYALNSALSLSAAYGVAYKAPATAYLYPENVYFDHLVFSHYDDDYRKRRYLYRTKVTDPTNRDLRSPHTHNAEAGFNYRGENFSLSLTAYLKIDIDGISSQSVIDTMYVQKYKKVGEEPSGQPLIAPDGDPELIVGTYYRPQNMLYSRSQGLELVGHVKEIRPLGLSANMSLVYNYSYYHTKGLRIGAADLQHDAVAGVYAPLRNNSQELVSTVSLTKHLSSIGFIINARLQNFWFRTYHRYDFSIYPIGYYDKRFNFVELTEEEARSAKLAHLHLTDSEAMDIKQPILVPNCHVRLSKEIGEGLRLSCYINNVFNYRPYIVRNDVRLYFNQAPAVGMELSYKF